MKTMNETDASNAALESTGKVIPRGEVIWCLSTLLMHAGWAFSWIILGYDSSLPFLILPLFILFNFILTPISLFFLFIRMKNFWQFYTRRAKLFRVSLLLSISFLAIYLMGPGYLLASGIRLQTKGTKGELKN